MFFEEISIQIVLPFLKNWVVFLLLTFLNQYISLLTYYTLGTIHLSDLFYKHFPRCGLFIFLMVSFEE